MKLNELIKEKRTQRGLSIRDVCHILDISKSTISRIENNENLNPFDDKVQRLLNLYSINYYDYILKEYKKQNNIDDDNDDLSPIHQKMIDIIKEKDQQNKQLRKDKKA